MNTPAHVVLNLLVVGRGVGQPWVPILVGALLPDLPMVGMYVVERFALGTPEAVIWEERYFSAGWQLFVDVFNSLPFMAVGFALAWWRGSGFFQVLFLSMALHGVADLLTHHEDAHRHFLPLSAWRFRSPVSYWNPAFHGRTFLLLELGMLVAGSGWLIVRGAPAVRRLAWGVLAFTVLFVAFALLVWGPLGEG